MFWLVFQTGIPRGEVCALDVGHVLLDDGIIVVKSSRFGRHITPNKSRRPRVFSISPALTEALVPFVKDRPATEPVSLQLRSPRQRTASVSAASGSTRTTS